MKKQLTLCMILKNGEILLGMKKRGHGQRHWNGFGGKIEEGETIKQAAIREVQEEASLKVENLNEIGTLEFSFESNPIILNVHIFRIKSYEGELQETEEMKPKWFTFDQIPYEQMWPNDKYWLPLLLEEKRFKGKFHFDRPSDTEHSAQIISYELIEI